VNKTESAARLKNSVRVFVEKICKMGCLEGSGEPAYIWDARFLKVNIKEFICGDGNLWIGCKVEGLCSYRACHPCVGRNRPTIEVSKCRL
jgi:hypothetical protein